MRNRYWIILQLYKSLTYTKKGNNNNNIRKGICVRKYTRASEGERERGINSGREGGREIYIDTHTHREREGER